MNDATGSAGASAFTTLRIALYVVTVSCIALAPFSGVRPEGAGGVFLAYVNPALAVIFLFVLLLDTLMTRIFLAEKSEETRRGLRRVIYANLLACALLLIAWLPMFRLLLQS